MTGFGVIESSGNSLRYVTSGCVKSGSGELAARLKVILEGLNGVIAEHGPAVVAVEKVFVNANPQSTLALGHAHGNGQRFGELALELEQQPLGGLLADAGNLGQACHVLQRHGLRQFPNRKT